MTHVTRYLPGGPLRFLFATGIFTVGLLLPNIFLLVIRTVLVQGGVELLQRNWVDSWWSFMLFSSAFICSGLAGLWFYKIHTLHLSFVQQAYSFFVAIVEIFILMVLYVNSLLLPRAFLYICAAICSIVAPLALWLLMRAMNQIIHGAQAQEHSRHLEVQCGMLVAHYHALGEQITQTIKMRNEIKEHLNTISKQLEDNETISVDTCFQQIETAFKTTRLPIYCEHPTINALLYNKLHYAAARGIEVHAQLWLTATIQIPDVDLICLLSNLLDNAIESCEKLETQSKVIRVSDIYQNDYYLLKVSNSKLPKPLVMQNGTPMTDKLQPELHGYGIEIMRDVTKRYQGTLRLHDLGETFEAIAMLQLQ